MNNFTSNTNNHSHVDNSFGKESQISKNDRFAKLSEKIAQIHNSEIPNPKVKIIKLEQKINEVEENLLGNIEALENKYSLLKDQLSKITKLVEEEKENKEKLKNKTNEEIKQLEGRIKNLFIEEREYTKNYVENNIKKLAEQLNKYESNVKQENEILNNNMISLKEYMDSELPNLNGRIDNETEERTKLVQNLVNEMNVEFGKIHDLVFLY